MRLEKLGDQLIPIGRRCHRFPARDRRLAVQLDERLEARAERCGSGKKMRVFLLEQRHPLLERSHERKRAADAHLQEQCVRHLHAADAPAFRFDEHRS